MEKETHEEFALTDLISVDILQQIQDGFSSLTGFAALTTDKYGTAVTKGSNFTYFCTELIRTSPLGCKRCGECDRNGAYYARDNGRSIAYKCHAGLVDFAAPIIANGEMVGSFIGGQLLTKKPDYEEMCATADDLGLSREEYIDAINKVQIVSPEIVDKATQYLYSIANILSEMAYSAYRVSQTNKELERAVRAKSDFLANMSHEIRTPMNAVLGMAEMALREDMTPAARDYLYQIKASGKNLLVIINDILDFSKIESGKMDIVPVSYEPLSMFNDLSGVICRRIGDKDIQFIMDISPDIPQRLLGDNVRIQQIMINLLNNAVKFTRHGAVTLSVYSEAVDDKNIVIKGKVTDTGSGIKPEDLKKLFRSFQQVDSKRNRNIEGTGLGLVITKQLLELMGGSISVESTYGKGSTFSFELPQKVVDATPLVDKRPEKPIRAALLIANEFVREQVQRDLDRIGAEHNDISEDSSLFSEENAKTADFLIIEKALYSENINDYLKKSDRTKCIVIGDYDIGGEIVNPNVTTIRRPVYFINLYAALGLINEYVRSGDIKNDTFKFIAPEANILIVDDNPVNLTVAAGLLEPLRMNIDTADGAAATIAMIKEKMYDIIFMDHMMPEVDGIETTHIIRRLITEYEEVPIIALTANALEGSKEMFLKEGMNDFVAKPIDLKDITAKIRKWLPPEKIVPVDKPAEETATEEEAPPEIEGLDTVAAMKLLGSKKLFMTVLRDYYIAIEKKAETISQYYAEEMWHEYTIEVHSLKSTSRQIGAEDLAADAFELELAGNNGNIALIKQKTDAMLSKLMKIKETLAPIFPDIKVKHSKGDAPIDITVSLLDELLGAIESFDTLGIDEVIEKMEQYRFDQAHEEIFAQLCEAAEEGDLDICTAIVESWQKELALIYIR